MAELAVTAEASGEAYVALVVGEPPEVRDSVALDALEQADACLLYTSPSPRDRS